MMNSGSWWVSSESDPRFNKSGHAFVGMFTIPKEASDWIDSQVKALGVPAPADLAYGYMKD